MNDSDEKDDKHVARLKRSSTVTVGGNYAKMAFGSETLEALQHLAEVVRGKKKFDGDGYYFLKRLSSGKPVPVWEAIQTFGGLRDDVDSYVKATGDNKADGAMNRVADAFRLEPITVTIDRSALRSQGWEKK